MDKENIDLKARVIAALKSGKRLGIRICSICAYPCAFNSDGTNLFYDSGCDCVNYKKNSQRDWQELNFYLDPNNGHIKFLEKFAEEHAAGDRT